MNHSYLDCSRENELKSDEDRDSNYFSLDVCRAYNNLVPQLSLRDLINEYRPLSPTLGFSEGESKNEYSSTSSFSFEVSSNDLPRWYAAGLREQFHLAIQQEIESIVNFDRRFPQGASRVHDFWEYLCQRPTELRYFIRGRNNSADIRARIICQPFQCQRHHRVRPVPCLHRLELEAYRDLRRGHREKQFNTVRLRGREANEIREKFFGANFPGAKSERVAVFRIHLKEQ